MLEKELQRNNILLEKLFPYERVKARFFWYCLLNGVAKNLTTGTLSETKKYTNYSEKQTSLCSSSYERYKANTLSPLFSASR